jgi:lipoprotein-releasing system ATP-binding protein
VGDGKELLLKLVGLLETPDSGEIVVDGICASALEENARAELRRRHFAYLFAAPFLLPGFTVIENVVMPMFKVLDSGPAEARKRAEELLSFLGAAPLEENRAGDLSPLDQRRVALARALATGPKVLLAEEPADDLPQEQHRQYIALLRAACLRWDVTAVIAVPATWQANSGEIVFDVVDGKVVPAAQELPRG